MPPSVIVVVVDRWHIGTLGPYGNTWLSTPELDRLAAQSFVFDHALADSADLATLYRSLWHGCAAKELRGMEPRVAGAESSKPRSPWGFEDSAPATLSLQRLMAGAGYSTLLLTDEPAVAELAGAASFAERIVLETPPVDRLADDVEHTQLYRLFSAAIDELTRLPEPFLLWVHARGMAGPWDAPYEFRQRLVEEGDPDAGTFVDPPDRMLPRDVDPDELLTSRCAYAGQALLLDACIGWLLDNLSENQLVDRCLLSVQGLRGFPLGEHGRLGPCDDALYAELVHVPWLLRFPDQLGAMCRTPALVQPADLLPTLTDWLHLPASTPASWARSLMPVVRGESDAVRDRVCIFSSSSDRQEGAIRTPAWHFRVPADGPPELFLKPDDRWEVNDVANRCPEIVEQLLLAQRATIQFVQANPDAKLPPLEPALLQHIE